MQITVWSNFSKRRNSTKQPTSGTSKTVLLKDATDVENPVFILNTTDMSINYVQAFGNYYFAKCRSLDGSRTEIVCTMDQLASYKTSISSYRGLIEYAAGSSRLDITDPRNTPTCKTATYSSYVSTGLPFSSTGSYIIGVVGQGTTGSTGSVQYWGLTAAEFTIMCNQIFNENIFDHLITNYQDIINSIVSCVWVPFSSLAIGGVFGSLTSVRFGDIALNAQGRPLTYRLLGPNNPLVLSITFPYSGTLGKTYVNRSPYSTGTLFLPFVGCVPLDVDMLYSYQKLTIDFIIDMVTGDIVYDVMYTDNNADYRISTYSGNCATKVPVTGQSYDGIGTATGLLTSVGGLVVAAGATMAGAAPLAIKAAGVAAGGAAMAFKSTELHSMINGAASGSTGAALGNDIIATIISNEPAETDLDSWQAEQGMPYFKTGTVSSFSGYLKFADASVSIPGSDEDKQAVNNYLNTGFYYE